MTRDAGLALTTFALILSVTAGVQVRATQASNPVLTSQTPCAFGRYEDQSAFTRRAYSQAEYDAARTSTTVECRRITYLSDGLKVVGFMVRPADAGRRYPVIVFNRGGLLDVGKIHEMNLVDFHDLASQGFIVVASQYRGNDGGEVERSLVDPMWVMCWLYGISPSPCPTRTPGTCFSTGSRVEA